MPRKPQSLSARFWAKGTAPETAIHVSGGRIVVPGVPGIAKSDKGVALLLTRAIAKGTARVERKAIPKTR
jgi:hypothetical protein